MMAHLGDLPLGHPLSLSLKDVKTPTNIPAWTIANAQATEVPDHQFIINPDGMIWAEPNLLQEGPTAVSFEYIGRLSFFIDSFATAPSTYAKSVKEHTHWSTVYKTTEEDLLYIDGHHKEESMACMLCGIYLPLRLLQMDHQRPQAGGEIEAIVKVLRVLGLTMAGPHGQKCTQLAKLVSETISIKKDSVMMTAAFVHPIKQFPVSGIVKVQPRSIYSKLQTSSTVGQRYTLTDKGMLFYSVVKHFKLLDRLVRQTMHSEINLRPLCSTCNISRGNGDLKIKKIQQQKSKMIVEKE